MVRSAPRPTHTGGGGCLNRAYSFLDIKSVDDEQRVIEGIATTPTTDRMDDIVEPLGAVLSGPTLPFLWQHESREAAIGTVYPGKPTKAGIPVRVQVERDDEPGPLKDRLDYAWRAIKKKLVRGLSIGFRSIRDEPIKGTFGVRFLEWEWLELSAVTIPANVEASITAIKSADIHGAASGASTTTTTPSPGASGITVAHIRPQPKRGRTMSATFTEQIKDYEATRAAKAARLEELMKAASDAGSTLDEAQEQEYDETEAEVAAIDKHLVRLRKQEKANAEKAVPVQAGTTDEGSKTRSGVPILTQTRNLPKGTAFTRYAMALAVGKGSVSDALRHAERWRDSTPEVLAYLKAEPGTTTDDVYGWAGPLVYPTNLVSEFVDLLRPATIIGKLTGIRSVPFNVRIPVQVGGSTVNWVGEAAPKPVTDNRFDVITLGHHKVAGIIVLTDELVKLSTPAAEDAVRRDLVEQTVRFIDAQFVDPNVTGGANNPASVTQGVVGEVASGVDANALYFDVNAALAAFDDTDLGTGSMYILMRPGLARAISALRNQLGQFEFSGLGAAGGTLMGFPVIVSNSVPASTIVLIKADEIFMADDGSVALDASKEATLDMNGGETPVFNLWQRNCIGIRAERGITWVKRRPDAVNVITSAAYGPEGGS